MLFGFLIVRFAESKPGHTEDIIADCIAADMNLPRVAEARFQSAVGEDSFLRSRSIGRQLQSPFSGLRSSINYERWVVALVSRAVEIILVDDQRSEPPVLLPQKEEKAVRTGGEEMHDIVVIVTGIPYHAG